MTMTKAHAIKLMKHAQAYAAGALGILGQLEPPSKMASAQLRCALEDFEYAIADLERQDGDGRD